MTTIAPDALYGIYKLVRPHFKTADIQGGVVGSTKSYHVSREDNIRKGYADNYSVVLPRDKKGDPRHASAIDISLNPTEMKASGQRLLAAFRSMDERLSCVREWYGCVDGRNVIGWNTAKTGSNPVGYLPGPRASDSSHVWHNHIAVYRDSNADKNAMAGLAEVVAGVAAGTFGWKGGTVAPPPPAVKPGVYYVDPAKVSTFLWGVDHETGEAVKKRYPREQIPSPSVAIIEYEGRQWLLTEAGYRYDLSYLTTTKPADPPPPPPPPDPKPDPPMPTEVLLTINVRKANVPDPNHPWSQRRKPCVQAIKHTRATLLGVQECRPDQRKHLEADLGFSSVARGNIVIFYEESVWTLGGTRGYDLKAGDDDRWLITATVKHRKTGKTLRVGNTHLTNLEPPSGGNDDWRLGQIREILAFAPDLDVLFGDFNSSKLVYDAAAKAGLVELRQLAPADKIVNRAKNSTHHYAVTKSDGRWIDNILTRRVKVVGAGVLLLDKTSKFANASDHNGIYGEIEA